MLFRLLESFIFGLTEALGASGTGQISLLDLLNNNGGGKKEALYLYIISGFALAVFLSFRHDLKLIVSHLSSDIKNIFINFIRLFSPEKRKKIGFEATGKSNYSRYALCIIMFLLPSIPLSCYFSGRLSDCLSESEDFCWIYGMGFIITAIFFSVIMFSEKGKGLPGDLGVIYCLILGIISGASVLPGVSVIMLVTAGLVIYGSDITFALRYALITRALTFLGATVFFIAAGKAVLYIPGFILLLVTAAGTVLGLSLMHRIIKNNVLLAVLTAVIFAEGIAAGLLG